MGQAKGSNVQLLYAEETAWGTTPASPAAKILPLTKESLGTNINTFLSARLKSDRAITDLRRGNKKVGGTVDVELDPNFHRLFKYALGSAATTGAGPYTHVVKGGSAIPTGLSIEKGFTDIAKFLVYRGMRVNTLTLRFPQEGYVTGTFDFLGRFEGGGTGSGSGLGSGASVSASPTDETGTPFTSYEAVVQEGGVAIGIVREAEIQIKNNLQDDGFVLGSETRASAVEGLRQVGGRLVIFFEDLTHYNKFLNGTESSLKFTMSQGALSVEILIPKIIYGGVSPIVDGPGPLYVGLFFSSKKDATEGTDIKVTFVNNIATI